jgi:monofunctional biosynthetic peptidoglycan transglycosylase
MSAIEASRIAAVLPLPKKRGAVAPKGFTRRYGNLIAERIPIVARDGLDACVYQGTTAPAKKALPRVVKKARPIPGAEFESTKALPQDMNAPGNELQGASPPESLSDQSSPQSAPQDQQQEPGNGV